MVFGYASRGDALYDIVFGFEHVLLLIHILRAAFAGT